ncbi:MAG: DUF1735 domain-containing protein [Chitinophagaceae bacterium]
MKYTTILKNLFVPLMACVILVACKKGEDITDLGDTGNTFIKLLGGGGDPAVVAMDVDPAFETIKVLDVRRDANSSASLNQPATITITNTQVFLDSYNVHNGTNYEILPPVSYTITPASGVTVSGDTWTITLAPGEHAREIAVTLNKPTMDLSLQYGFGFQIIQTTSGVVSKASGTQIVNPLIKNVYDGVYEVTGTMADAGNPGLTGLFPMNYHLLTTGATSVAGWDPDYWVDYFIPIQSGADVSGYGSFSPIFNFDNNGNVISVTNRYGQPAGNGRYAALDPSGINKRDPVTGDIDVKFFMYQPSVVPLPNPRVKFDWHMKYVGPR